MDLSKLVRAPQRVHKALKEVDGKRIVAVEPCKIFMPARYAEQGLAMIGAEIYILGIFAIVVENAFGVCMLNTMVPIEPTWMTKIKVNDDDYYEFGFQPGDTVIKNVNLVKTDTLVYSIYDEFLAKGYVPPYMDYNDLGHLFDTAKAYAGANIGTNPEVTQLIASIVARDPKDRTRYYRQAIGVRQDMDTIKPVFVPLKSVAYSATNTLNKIGGSYIQEGIQSSLAYPSTRVERVESILRQ